LFATCSAPDKALTSLFALGWTQHFVGAQNIRTMAMVQLLLGNIGVAGDGMNALRGHSNIQGLTDVGLLSNAMPGYMTLPRDGDATFDDYMRTRLFQAATPRAGQLLAELQEVLRELPEGDLRQGRDRRQQLGLRLAAETRHPAV
jgi:anaerobic selenocysteine-containing dehydrogenase